MSTTIITGFDLGPIQVNGDHSTVTVKKNATLMIGGDPSGLVSAIVENITNPTLNHDNVYNIDGTVLGAQVAMYLVGARDTITVGETGIVEAQYAIAMASGSARITNSGSIIGELASGSSGAGIYAMNSTGLAVDNTGLITGANGIMFVGSKASMVNGEDGIIIGNETGIIGQLVSGGALTFVNHGYLTGKSGAAFIAGGGDVTVTNDGTIKGQVTFSEGDDTLDNRGGTLTNLTVVGGNGNDTLIVDDSKHFLLENAAEGTDTVKSSVTYTLSAEVERLFLLGKTNINGFGTDGDNTIKGNAGKNALSGLGGIDSLDGAAGNDRLKGGAGNDVFHFATGYGDDTVLDFTHMQDKIDVSDWTGIKNFSKVLANAHDQGANVLIEHGTDSLLILGVHEGNLTASDFLFA